MCRRRRSGSLWALAALLFGGVTVAAGWPGGSGESSDPEPIAIIVNRSNPVENLSFAELKKIFLGERSHWPHGRRITLVMQDREQPERRAVLDIICRMDESDFDRHYMHGLFTGSILAAPKTLATPEGVRKFVFNAPGAIGYVRVTDMDATVKVLRVEGLLPSQKGYRVQIVRP